MRRTDHSASGGCCDQTYYAQQFSTASLRISHGKLVAPDFTIFYTFLSKYLFHSLNCFANLYLPSKPQVTRLFYFRCSREHFYSEVFLADTARWIIDDDK